jgi:hypothetical protein
VWRRLRKLGVVQLVDGLVALPASPANVEAFDWLADEVIEAGGEAWAFIAQPGNKRQDAALRSQITAAVSEEYRALVDEARTASADPSRRTIERLRRELRRIQGRDHFGVKEGESARRAIERASAALEAVEAAR